MMTHKFIWGNNEKRATLKGRFCRIKATGAKGSVVVEFENGQRECISRRAIRKITNRPAPERRHYGNQDRVV